MDLAQNSDCGGGRGGMALVNDVRCW